MVTTEDVATEVDAANFKKKTGKRILFFLFFYSYIPGVGGIGAAVTVKVPKFS